MAPAAVARVFGPVVQSHPTVRDSRSELTAKVEITR